MVLEASTAFTSESSYCSDFKWPAHIEKAREGFYSLLVFVEAGSRAKHTVTIYPTFETSNK